MGGRSPFFSCPGLTSVKQTNVITHTINVEMKITAVSQHAYDTKHKVITQAFDAWEGDHRLARTPESEQLPLVFHFGELRRCEQLSLVLHFGELRRSE